MQKSYFGGSFVFLDYEKTIYLVYSTFANNNFFLRTKHTCIEWTNFWRRTLPSA